MECVAGHVCSANACTHCHWEHYTGSAPAGSCALKAFGLGTNALICDNGCP